MSKDRKLVVHCKKEPYDVYIGRPSKWGNPFTHHKHPTAGEVIVESREEAIECYKNWLSTRPDLIEAAKKELKGKVLGCWCDPLDCHGHILAKAANEDNMRILSGIQPSGTIHIGNYFGMIKPLLSFQDKGEVFCFLADYHSMTSLFDAKERKENTMEAATTLLACGLDPEKTCFFKQSDVPYVAELAWMLSTVTPMGLLERCHSYKDKTAKGISANHGLFAYPVLMAADILIYQSNLVPVGKDQQQHLEVTRDIATKFNDQYGSVFTMPEPFIQPQVATVPGTDGQKMSKSYGNTIEVFCDDKVRKKKIMSIKMDSRSPSEPKPDAANNTAIQLLKLMAPEHVSSDMETKLREGGLGYGDLKVTLNHYHYIYFHEMKEKYDFLKKNQDYVEQVLERSAEKAIDEACKTITKVRKSVGL